MLGVVVVVANVMVELVWRNSRMDGRMDCNNEYEIK
jgi:hypothetical protein